MELKFEVHLVSRDLCTPPSLKIVKLSDNGRNINKENVNVKVRMSTNKNNDEEKALLHRVVQNQNIYSAAIVRFLLEEGADVNLRTTHSIGWQDKTALHIATNNMTDYSLDIVKILWENNSPFVNESDAGEMTPLHYAVQSNHKSALDMVRLLLEKGANINQKDLSIALF